MAHYPKLLTSTYSTPDLQKVTDVNNTTTNSLIVNGVGVSSELSPTYLNHYINEVDPIQTNSLRLQQIQTEATRQSDEILIWMPNRSGTMQLENEKLCAPVIDFSNVSSYTIQRSGLYLLRSYVSMPKGEIIIDAGAVSSNDFVSYKKITIIDTQKELNTKVTISGSNGAVIENDISMFTTSVTLINTGGGSFYVIAGY